jgi:hypothetical protein
MSQKTKTTIGWVLTVLVAFLFAYSAFMKLTGSEKAMQGAASFGLSVHKIKLLGIVEIISILFFIFPRTGVLGTLLVAAYVGGAIATHLEHFMPIHLPVIIECVVFIAAVLRFPELCKRLMGSADTV